MTSTHFSDVFIAVVVIVAKIPTYILSRAMAFDFLFPELGCYFKH